MKLVSFETANQTRLGVVQGETIVDVRATLELLAARRAPRPIGTQARFKEAAKILTTAGPAP